MKDRARWQRLTTTGMQGVDCYIHDNPPGRLTVLISHDPPGWHLSISHTLSDGTPGRYPTWDEIVAARYRFLPDSTTMAMLLPPRAEYVNLHPTTFHLWEVVDPR